MGIIKTDFVGLYIYEPRVFKDDRGYFFESYNANVWKAEGIEHNFVQDNESRSQYGTIRGLHYQVPPFAQTKLVRVTKGKVLDVVVDLRQDQPTYGKQFSIVLSNKNKKQFLIPKGFAHGFVALSKVAVFSYKCDNFYNKESEGGINPLDPNLAIDWRVPQEGMIVSEKDRENPIFGEHKAFAQ